MDKQTRGYSGVQLASYGIVYQARQRVVDTAFIGSRFMACGNSVYQNVSPELLTDFESVATYSGSFIFNEQYHVCTEPPYTDQTRNRGSQV